MEDKLTMVCKNCEKRIARLREIGTSRIQSYSSKAVKIGVVPIVALPIIHGMCIKMPIELAKLVGINSTKKFASEIFENSLLGVITTPFIAVPVLSAITASAYIQTLGEICLDALMCVIERSTDDELSNNGLMARIQAQLRNDRNRGGCYYGWLQERTK